MGDYSVQRRLAAILAADVAGYTRLMEEDTDDTVAAWQVFPAPDGSPWNPSRFTNAFAALARNHGFKGVRFHDLRHTHATLMLIQGVHPKIVSERLGHATIAITLDTYSHVLPGLQKEAVVQLDQSLRVAMAKNNFTN